MRPADAGGLHVPPDPLWDIWTKAKLAFPGRSDLSWQSFDDGCQPALPGPADWLAAQSALAVELAGAALAAGRLEARLALMDDRARAGATRRLALIEIAATATIKGRNPARVIDALAAHPVLHTAQVEDLAGISRDTAERLLSRMRKMGLVREITGARRFRLWAAGM